MKKWVSVLIALLISASAFLGLAACAPRGEDGGFNDDGSYKPSEQGTQLSFWGWGDQVEGQVFNQLVKDFNATIGAQNNIKVTYNKIPQTAYATNAKMALSGSNPPDVVYVGDGDVKSWAAQGWLQQLDAQGENNYLIKNGGIDLSAMWQSAVGRYRYDAETTMSGGDTPLWGLPKDIGPTVVYYNKTYMTNAGITIVSVPEIELNEKAGKTIPGTNKTYSYRGYDANQKVFNNRVAMSWEETVALAKLLKKSGTPANNLCDYGFFTEWWFNYGWSVGGDCLEYTTDENGEPYYKFTLGDETPNYIVKDDVDSVTVGAREYKAGEIISFNDKKQLTQAQKTSMNQLPSMKEAFTEFCRLSASSTTVVDTAAGTELKGYDVAMNPKTVANQDYTTYFTTGKLAMFISGRWNVTTLRNTMKNYDWDVAPLPVYRTYNDDGTVKAHGVYAGHSGSMAISIAKGSKNKNAAWMLLQYICGETGQTAQSLKGFAIPNQIELANDETIFLQTNQKPANSVIFVEAAKYQRPGDWNVLKDGEWINEWAPLLNSDVRDGKMNLSTFFNTVTERTQKKLKTYIK